MDELYLVPFLLLMGMAIGLSAWLLISFVLAVPEEDRSFRDQPPVGFRLCWGLIHVLAWYLETRVPARVLSRQEKRLQVAGMDYVLSPSQMVAGHLVGGLLGAAMGFGMARLLGWPAGWPLAVLGCLGAVYPSIWLKERMDMRRRDLLKTLPFYLDIITLCVEAGLTFNGALRQATLKGPPGVLRHEFQRILRDIRAGKLRADALRAFAGRVDEPSVSVLVSSIIQAETLGMNLGPLLRSQADQRRTERFLRAEKLAMEAPVKMLFPLVAFIFPCTFVVLGFPIAMMFKDIQ
jgi:tight adherence protein C